MKVLLVLSSLWCAAVADNFDQFTYGNTKNEDGKFPLYGPDDWRKVSCSDKKLYLGNAPEDSCLGWTYDSWQWARGWSLNGNQCRNGGRQSPIPFDRSVGDPKDGDFEDPEDWHWMKYEPGNCNWEDMTNNEKALHPNGFRIDRDALRIVQPVDEKGDPVCPNGMGGGNWPRVDFSKGWKWMWLTNTEIKTPAEHTQNGKKYDAEIHLSHVYSLTPEEHRSNRELSKIGIFMQAYDHIAPWPYLDKLICEFRRVEDRIRDDCGKGSVPPYPGCFDPNRPDSPGRRKLRQEPNEESKKHLELFDERAFHNMINIRPEHYEQNPDFTEQDYIDMIQDYDADENKHRRESFFNETDARHLINYDFLEYFAYEPMLKVATEYYFRYEGSQTTPPCHETTHWRFMKDPIRINKRQLTELERLIAQRVSPRGSAYKECEFETAGKPRGGDSTAVNVNRPIQNLRGQHNMLFTECKDWHSKRRGDRYYWCKIDNVKDRLYKHPYSWPGWEEEGF